MTTTPGRTARGALLGVATVVGERAIAFVVVVVLARTLSPAAFGVYGYVLAGTALVQVLCDQGIEVAGVARMSAVPGAAAEAMGAVMLWRLLVWLVIAVPVGWLALPALSADPGASIAPIGLAASGLVLVGASASMRSACRAAGAMGAMAAVAIADGLLGGAAVVLAARSTGLAGVFAARVLGSLVVTAGALALGRWRPRLARLRWPALREVGVVALPLAANALLIAVQVRAGHVLAMRLAGPAVVGLLGVAARMTEVLGVLPEGVLLAVFPRMAAAPHEAAKLAADAARRLAVVVLAPVVALVVGAGPLAATVFGPAYAGAAPAIAILAWGALFATTGGVILHAIVARGGERLLVAANVAAAVLAVVLQTTLIPALGLSGAALATVLTIASGQACLLVPGATREIVVGVWRRAVPAVALAALVAAVAMRLRPDLAGAAGAAVAYLGLASLVGLVGRDDWRLLAATVFAWRRG